MMKASKNKLIIDIGTKNIKIVEVEERFGYFYVIKHVMLETPGEAFEEGAIKFPDKISPLIEHALKSNGITTKSVIATVSSPHILSREIVLPKVNLKDMTLLVDMEAPNHFPVDISLYSIDFKVLGEVLEDEIPQYNTLILITPLRILESYITLFEKCGLFIEKIDFKGNSIAKLIRQIDKSKMFEEFESNAVIDIGCDSSNITICKNGVIKYSRALPFGSKQYNVELMEILGCTDDDAEKIKISAGVITTDDESDLMQKAAKQAWVRSSVPLFDEITRVFDFFTSRQNTNLIDRILLIGGGTQIPNLVEYIHNLFEMQIDFLTCEGAIEFVEKDIDIKQFSTYFANCVGAILDEL